MKVAGVHAKVLWHSPHWPEKWLAGLSLVWQSVQLAAKLALWLKVEGFQALVVWHSEHCPAQ